MTKQRTVRIRRNAAGQYKKLEHETGNKHKIE